MKKIAHRRINITLPESTVALLDTVAGKGSRSTFIDTAIRDQITSMKRTSLRESVKAGAIARAVLSLEIAREWFPIEEELWQE